MRLVTLAILLCACDDSGPTRIGPNEGQGLDDTASPSGDACDQRSLSGICTQYVGSNFGSAEILQNCGNSGDVVAACPTGNQLGRCDVVPGTPSETRTYYYDGPFYNDGDLDEIETTCTLYGGVWN